MANKTVTCDFDKWIFASSKSDIIKNKDRLIDSYIGYMLNRTQGIFEYDGLPDTIDYRILEKNVQIDGFTCFVELESGQNVDGTRHEKGIYALPCGLNGMLNEKNQPTMAIVNVPYFNLNKEYSIEKCECIIMNNDSLRLGLMPMFERNASMLAENDITLRFIDINNRIPSVPYADNDQTRRDLEKFFSMVENGEKIGVVGGNAFFEGLKNQVYNQSTQHNIKDCIELKQYLMSSWYLELGLQANYNMKRESINDSEASMNDDCLQPLVDNMLENRKIALKEINAKWGLDIRVRKSSAWKNVEDRIQIDMDNAKNANDANETTSEEINEDNNNETK